MLSMINMMFGLSLRGNFRVKRGCGSRIMIMFSAKFAARKKFAARTVSNFWVRGTKGGTRREGCVVWPVRGTNVWFAACTVL